MATYQKNGVYFKYDSMRLQMEYIYCAPTLEEFVDMLMSTPIWEELLKDASSFDRQHRWNIGSTCGMSGRVDYFLMEYREILGIAVPKGHHILHVSCAGKLNQGVKCFGPDFISLLYDSFYENTKELKGKERSEIYSLAPNTDQTYPCGRIIYTFDKNVDENHKRMEYLLDLVERFKKETRACSEGTWAFLAREDRNPGVMFAWLKNTNNENLIAEVKNLTEDDFKLLCSVAKNKIRTLDSEPEESDPEWEGRRRRVPRRTARQ